MSDTYNRPSTWPDGVTPPAFLIQNLSAATPFAIEILMPNPEKGFDPEFNEAIVKRSKYGGRIHKSLKGDLWDAEFQWVLTADEIVLGLDPTGDVYPVLDVNYLNVIQMILDVDAVFDTTAGCFLGIIPHGADPRGDLDDADYDSRPPRHYTPFRLSNRKDIIKALKGKTVAKTVKVQISTDGYIPRLPINTILPPVSYR